MIICVCGLLFWFCSLLVAVGCKERTVFARGGGGESQHFEVSCQSRPDRCLGQAADAGKPGYIARLSTGRQEV